MTTEQDSVAVALARECVYRFLSAALSDPKSCRWGLLREESSSRLACEAAALLRAEDAEAGELDLDAVMRELADPAAMSGEFVRVFGLVPTRDCLPLETEFHPNSEPFFRAQQLADVAGFYRAFGLQPSRSEPERPDHIAMELDFMAHLLARKRLAASAQERETCANVETEFVRDHLLWWVPLFSATMRRKSLTGFYAATGQALAAFLSFERRHLNLPPARVPLFQSPVDTSDDDATCAACSA